MRLPAIFTASLKKCVALTATSLLALLFVSCEKNVDFSLKEDSPKLVVEATIENGQPPVVFLSNSLNYFSQISSQLLASSPCTRR